MRSRLCQLLCIAVLLSWSGDTGAFGAEADRIAPPDKAAKSLMVEVTVADPYSRWRTMPGLEPFSPGKNPHGPFVTIYLNDQAFSSWSQAGVKAMASGSILVIENYDENRQLTAYGVMQKLRGFNPEGGDWYWLRVTAEGNIDFYGKVEACISCHKGEGRRDYVVK